MACPCFYPTRRMEQTLWPHPSRLPLGDGFEGVCSAEPANEVRPADATLQEYCNLGYARGRCSRFPPGAEPDAVRFALSGDEDGIVRIYYVLEKDHRPHEHGPLEYDAGRRTFASPHPDRVIGRQAEAFVESYLRRRRECLLPRP